ncbi:MAG: TerB family tellurite resistance protein [Pseudomonadota bacterium]
MGWFGKLTFGSLGLFLGGPLGAIAGVALGHLLVDKREDHFRSNGYMLAEQGLESAEETRATYFISLFSILGKLAKIDNVVTRDEIVVVRNFIDKMPADEREKQFAKKIFNEAKNSSYAIEDFARQFYRAAGQQPTLVLSFFHLLFQLTAADGKLHPSEEDALLRMKDIFRISDRQFNDIKGVYFRELDQYYKLLNCTSESSDQEIKSNYKKLVKDFHPDTIVSKGLPEEFLDFATNRFREIQEAFEKIRQERKSINL